jgi:hypothetical protein
MRRWDRMSRTCSTGVLNQRSASSRPRSVTVWMVRRRPRPGSTDSGVMNPASRSRPIAR